MQVRNQTRERKTGDLLPHDATVIQCADCMTTPRWLEPFSEPFRAQISAQLLEPGSNKLACFDADGTLWNEDVGEALFRWLAAGQLLPWLGAPPDVETVWAEYEARVAKNRSEGYAWCVQCMAGLAEADGEGGGRPPAAPGPHHRPPKGGLLQGRRGAGGDAGGGS